MIKLSPERLEEIRLALLVYQDKGFNGVISELLSHIAAIEAEFSEKNHLFNMKWLEWKTAYDVIEEERDAFKSELEAVKKERDRKDAISNRLSDRTKLARTQRNKSNEEKNKLKKERNQLREKLKVAVEYSEELRTRAHLIYTGWVNKKSDFAERMNRLRVSIDAAPEGMRAKTGEEV